MIALRDAVASALGAEVLELSPVAGGSINEAYRARLAGRPPVFVKHNRGCDPNMFVVEARGLEWLAAAGALRVPEVLAIGAGCEPFYLVLEWLSPGARAADFPEALGRGLAELHRSAPAGFGLDHDNFIGSLAQDNTPCRDWPTFYWSRRLEPQLRLARDAGLLTARDSGDFDDLSDRLAELVGPPEPAARLHGDLWSGNLHSDSNGCPCLIDPAVYGGHREVDLAMMQLFGGFDAKTYAAYEESSPLAADWRERTSLYQLYYLLVHVNLFGGGYVGQTRAALRQYL